jgi:hypothetical protein
MRTHRRGGSAAPITLKTDSMETLIENSPAPSVEVPRLVRLRCWLRNLRHWKTGRAIRDLERAFWSDDGFVLTWKCHIAMTLLDRCGLPHDKADELMRALFGCKPNAIVEAPNA